MPEIARQKPSPDFSPRERNECERLVLCGNNFEVVDGGAFFGVGGGFEVDLVAVVELDVADRVADGGVCRG